MTALMNEWLIKSCIRRFMARTCGRKERPQVVLHALLHEVYAQAYTAGAAAERAKLPNSQFSNSEQETP